MTKIDPLTFQTFFPMNTKHNLYSRRPLQSNHLGSHRQHHHLLIKEPSSVSSRDNRSEGSSGSQEVATTASAEETEDRLSESYVEDEESAEDEQYVETDSSIEETYPESEDQGEQSASEVTTRQLSYLSLPSLLSSASGVSEYVDYSSSRLVAPGRRRSFSASPAISCESVMEEDSDPAEVPVDYEIEDNGEDYEDEEDNEDTPSDVNEDIITSDVIEEHEDYITSDVNDDIITSDVIEEHEDYVTSDVNEDIITSDVIEEHEDYITSDVNEEDEDEYINLKFRVQRDPYIDDMAKVTVSVQPPSEIDEDLANLPEDESVGVSEVDDEDVESVEEVSDRIEDDEQLEVKVSKSFDQHEPGGGEKSSLADHLVNHEDNVHSDEDEQVEKVAQVAVVIEEGESNDASNLWIDQETDHMMKDGQFSHDIAADLLQKLASGEISPTPSSTGSRISLRESPPASRTPVDKGRHSVYAESLKETVDLDRVSITGKKLQEAVDMDKVSITGKKLQEAVDMDKVSITGKKLQEAVDMDRVSITGKKLQEAVDMNKVSITGKKLQEAADIDKVSLTGKNVQEAADTGRHSIKSETIKKPGDIDKVFATGVAIPKSLDTDLHSVTGVPVPEAVSTEKPSIAGEMKEETLDADKSPIVAESVQEAIDSDNISITGSIQESVKPLKERALINSDSVSLASNRGSIKSINSIRSYASTVFAGKQIMRLFGKRKESKASSLSGESQIVPEAAADIKKSVDDSKSSGVEEIKTELDMTKTEATQAITNVNTPGKGVLGILTKDGVETPKKSGFQPNKAQQAAMAKMRQIMLARRSKPSIAAIATLAGRKFGRLKKSGNETPTEAATPTGSGGRSTPSFASVAITSRKMSSINQENLLKPPKPGEAQVDVHAPSETDDSNGQIINKNDGLPDAHPQKDSDPVPEAEDYLSVFAGSFEHSEDHSDDEGNTKQRQQKIMTQESIDRIEQEKDELLKEWQTPEEKVLSELDENFSTIIEDMVNELDMPMLIVPIPIEQKMILKEEEQAEEKSKQRADKKEKANTKKQKKRRKKRKIIHGSDTDDESEDTSESSDKDPKSATESLKLPETPENFPKDPKSTKGSPQSLKISGMSVIEELNAVNSTEKVDDIVAVKAAAKFIKRQSSLALITSLQSPLSSQSTPKKNEEEEEAEKRNRRKWKNPLEIASTFSQYLGQVKTETVENNLSEIIPLLTRLIGMSRKTKTELELPTLIAGMSATRVLCDRLLEIKSSGTAEKALKNMDLSYLIRVLCKISADDKAKAKPEASFTLARLVKASGPELITRPIYFLLVMENEGHGKSKGSHGAKTKAAALDTLTYTFLSFPKEDFDDLEEIARWVGILVFHPQRRVRQSALECCSVIGNRLGDAERAITIFRRSLVQEQEQHYSRSSDDGIGPKNTLASSQAVLGKGIFDVIPINAIAARLRRRKALPLPSFNGLIEYGVKVPIGEELIHILMKMHEKEAEEFEFSTSSDESYHSDVGKLSFGSGAQSESEESIRMSDLEKSAKEAKDNGYKPKKPQESEDEDDGRPIKQDVAYILCGRGKVNKQEHVLVEENLKEVNDMVFAERLKIFMKEVRPKKKKKRKKNKEKIVQVDDDLNSEFGCEPDSEVYF